jgi:hypothetical protein
MNQPANLVNPNPYPGNQSVDDWVSKAAFAAPDLGSYGNLGYNNLKGPGILAVSLRSTHPTSGRSQTTLAERV